MALKMETATGGVPGTRGGLARARIVEIADAKIVNNMIDVKSIDKGTIDIPCMFNPNEYTLTKSNTFEARKSPKDKNSPRADFTQSGPQTLQLHLLFDTYRQQKDVATTTRQLWQLMAVKETPAAKEPQDRSSPPLVAFIWGSFYFVAYITQMTQKFTLFAHTGIPVRAEVDITFTQYVDVDDYPPQNPTSGGGPIDRMWTITGGDRLDTIAAAVYGNATKWRYIADYNQLADPIRLQPGQQLLIPFETSLVNGRA